MSSNLHIEWTIAQEQRRDLLRDVAQDRPVRRARAQNQARAEREPGVKSGRGAQLVLKLRTMWRQAAA